MDGWIKIPCCRFRGRLTWTALLGGAMRNEYEFDLKMQNGKFHLQLVFQLGEAKHFFN